MKSLTQFLEAHNFIVKGHTVKQKSKYVDLGLPSGNLWYSTNINAKEDFEVGDFFAWGETEPRTDNKNSWADYKYSKPNTNSDYIMTKYNDSDKKIHLDKEDDVANVILGNDWHIPTLKDYEELCNNCDQKFVENYQNKNIKGWLLTSQSNKESIFFPLANLRDGKVNYSGTSVKYLTNELSQETGRRDKYCLCIDVDNDWIDYDGWETPRKKLCLVRAVKYNK